MIPSSSIWLVWPVAAALVIYWRVKRRDGFYQVLSAIGLCAYVWWICSVAFFPLPWGGPTSGSAALAAGGGFWHQTVNLVPFREMFHSLSGLGAGQIVRQYGGNLLLFVPFTLFAPFMWPRLRNWRWPLVVGLAGSIAIELVQLGLSALVGYGYRRADIDDVIVNTVGALLGYAVFLLVERRRTRRKAGAREASD